MRTILILLVVVAYPARTVAGQTPVDADSIVEVFLERGSASFFPVLLLKGCPELEPWQNRALNRLLSLELSPERVIDLATNLGVTLNCGDPRLEAWFIREMERALRGEEHLALAHLMSSLRGYRSPEVRDFARSKMYDRELRDELREEFGMLLFSSVESVPEGQAELTTAMEARSLPYGVAVSAVFRLLREDAAGTIREMLDLAERDPRVVLQAAFGQLTLAAPKYADEATLNDLRRRLGSLAEQPELEADQRWRVMEGMYDLSVQ